MNLSKLRSRLKRAIRSLTGGQSQKRAPRETPDPLAYTLGKSQVTIGAFTYGKNGLEIKQWGEGANLSIGTFCSIAKNVTVILGGNHRTDWVTTFPFGHIYGEDLGEFRPIGHPATRGDVTIGHDVWIGYGATILSGVTIGSGAVIASNAVLTRDVAPYEIWGGNPARRLSCRFEDEVVTRLLALQWWALPLPVIREIVQDLSSAPDIAQLDRIEQRIAQLMTQAPDTKDKD